MRICVICSRTNINLQTVELGMLNTSKVEDMDSMFLECTELTEIDLSSFDLSGLKYSEYDYEQKTEVPRNPVEYMLSKCVQLVTLKTPLDMGEAVISLPGFFSDSANEYGVVNKSCINKTLTKLTNIGAIDGTDNTIKWSYDEATQTITISGKGERKDDYYIQCMPTEAKYIVFSDCMISGSLRNLFDNMQNVESIDFTNCTFKDITNTANMFNWCSKLKSLDLSKLDTSKVTDMFCMFQGCDTLKMLDVSHFNTSNVTDMSGMFNICSALTELDLSNFDTSKVDDMSFMIAQCRLLKSVDISSFDTSNVTDMYYMFAYNACLEELDVRHFNTSKVTDMRQMFKNCSMLKCLDLSSFDLSGLVYYGWDRNTATDGPIDSVEDMLVNCTSLRTIHLPANMGEAQLVLPGIYMNGTSEVDVADASMQNLVLTKADINTLVGTNNKIRWKYDETTKTITISGTGVRMPGDYYQHTLPAEAEYVVFDNCNISGDLSYLFAEITKLKGIDFTGCIMNDITNMNSMFHGCIELETLDLSFMDTSKVTDMGWTFAYCFKLKELNISNFDTSNVTNMQDMFFGVSEVTTLDVSGFNTANVTNMNSMFFNCNKLANLNVSGFVTSKVTDMRYMFYECTNLQNLDCSNFDLSSLVYEQFDWQTQGNVPRNPVDQMLKNCIGLTIFKTPSVMGDATIELPAIYTDGTSTYTTVDKSCQNKLLTKAKNAGLVPGTQGKIQWFYNSDTKTINITGSATREAGYYNTSFPKEAEYVTFSNCNISGDLSRLFIQMNNLKNIDFTGCTMSDVTNTRSMFEGCFNLTKLDLSGLDTSKVTDMGWMFCDCNSLKTLDVSHFNTSNVTDMSFMFSFLYALDSLDVSHLDTSNVIYMIGMFQGCDRLTSLNVSSFNTANVTDMSSMFADCLLLTEIDISNFDTSDVADMSDMFYNTGLQSLDISNFDLSGLEYTRYSYQFQQEVPCNPVQDMLTNSNNLLTIKAPANMGDAKISLGRIYTTDGTNKLNAIDSTTQGKTFTKYTDALNIFTDVTNDKWYVAAVQYAYDSGLMSGVSVDNFAPEQLLKREQFAQILYSQAGKPYVDKESVFTDVQDKNAWYYNAVVWANQNGIVNGIGDEKYGVDADITREQLALMMYKYAQILGLDLSVQSGALDNFADKERIDVWAKEAVEWAVSHGIMSGKPGIGVDPLSTATRAECAAMMKKMLEM